MLKIAIPDQELYDEEKEEFITIKGATLSLEHSLVSVSKWESKWKKPYISDTEKTNAEFKDYVRCMCTTQNVDPLTFEYIPVQTLNKIVEYINDPMTATWFSNKEHKGNGEAVTSELIYYWMTALNIPMECQKWHLNRLLTLIRIAGEKNQPPKKMNKNDILKQNRALNARRKAKYKTKG